MGRLFYIWHPELNKKDTQRCGPPPFLCKVNTLLLRHWITVTPLIWPKLRPTVTSIACGTR